MDGKYHQMATLALTAPAGAIAYTTTGDAHTAAAAAVGCLIGLLIHPDRDLRVSRVDFQLASWTLGLGLLWAVVWWPYSSLIPRHRHPLSHWPIVGTTGRVAYALALLYLVSFVLPSVWFVTALPYVWQVALAAGLCASDILHWLMDGLPVW